MRRRWATLLRALRAWWDRHDDGTLTGGSKWR
jgi:hypothetical protein